MTATAGNSTRSENDLAARQPRRYSEGMERVPVALSVRRVGRYSDGLAPALTLTADVVGSYADGLVARPDPSDTIRVGSYGDCDRPTTRKRRRSRVAQPAPANA